MRVTLSSVLLLESETFQDKNKMYFCACFRFVANCILCLELLSVFMCPNLVAKETIQSIFDLRSSANLLQVPYPDQGLYRFHNLYGDAVMDNPIIQPSPQFLSLKLASATVLDDVYTR